MKQVASRADITFRNVSELHRVSITQISLLLSCRQIIIVHHRHTHTASVNYRGRAIAQAVSRWCPTAEARVQAQVRSCGICGGQSDIGAGFLRVLRFPLPIFIPPIAPQSPSSIIGGWYNRQVVAAVPSGLSLTPLTVITIKKQNFKHFIVWHDAWMPEVCSRKSTEETSVARQRLDETRFRVLRCQPPLLGIRFGCHSITGVSWTTQMWTPEWNPWRWVSILGPHEVSSVWRPCCSPGG
jgi:hypothetical protein